MNYIIVMLLCLVAGAVLSFVAVRFHWIPTQGVPAFFGLSAFILWSLVWLGSYLVGQTDLYPRYRIVTDGVFYEVEEKYAPFDSWSWRTHRDFTSVDSAYIYIEGERRIDRERKEHKNRNWKAVE